MSSNLPEHATASPFDALMRTDEHGEYWSAREIAEPLGYSWRRFTDAIERGRIALQANGQDPDDHIRSWTTSSKINARGNGGPGLDYRMTREGVYATIQGADPRKPEIALAWSYFRTKTRQAETGGLDLGADPLDALEAINARMTQAIQIARQERAGRLEAEGRLAIGAPKIALVDTYVKQGDASTFAVVAGQLGVTAPQLRQYLVTRGVIYRRTVEQRWSTTRQKLEPVYEWLARSQYTKWFTPKDQLRAPRMHNGQYRTTLYFTPIGKAGVELMIRKRPILGQGELDVDGGGS